MKSKKLLSSLMALSIIATSSLALGASVQAAPAKTNNVITNDTKLTAQSTLLTKYLEPVVSEEGTISWLPIPGAASYKYKVVYQSPNNVTSTQVKGAGTGGENYTQEKGTRSCFDKDGTYYIKVKAFDSNGNLIQQDLLVAYRQNGRVGMLSNGF